MLPVLRAFRVCLALLASGAVAGAALPAAGEAPEQIRGYVPPELYRYQTIVFPNGFRAVLNPRQVSRSVSLRLVVDVGQLDFDCRDRELPHLAEHLMFSGWGELTESDLDAMVGAIGGEWNAFTHSWKTEYQMEVYSGHALDGLDILYRMFTATEITPERLEAARGVIHAESGGEPGVMRDLLYRWGFEDGAVGESYRRFVPDSRAFCPGVPATDHLSVADLHAFLRAHYRPDAMLLIAVGDFDPQAFRRELAGGFAMLPASAGPRPQRVRPALVAEPQHYRTWLNPLLGNTAYVTMDLMVGHPQPFSDDAFALQQLAGHLDARLYEALRVDRGLAYTPGASLVDQGDFMTLLLEAEVDPARAEEALALMRGVIDEVRSAGIDADTLAAQRQGIHYRLAAGLDRNASFADIYVEASELLASGEPLPDIEAAISAWDAGELQARAAEWLAPGRALVYESMPTFTYATLGWLLIGLTVVGALALWVLGARARGRRVH